MIRMLVAVLCESNYGALRALFFLSNIYTLYPLWRVCADHKTLIGHWVYVSVLAYIVQDKGSTTDDAEWTPQNALNANEHWAFF